MSTLEKAKLPFNRTRELFRIFLGEESETTETNFEKYNNTEDAETAKVLEESISNIEAAAEKSFNSTAKKRSKKVVSKAETTTPVVNEKKSEIKENNQNEREF